MGEIFENFSKIMQAADRRQKVACLREFKTKYADPKESKENILAAFDECYLLVLKCYEDRFESVREAAVDLVTSFIKRLPPNDFVVANVVQTLKQRMGSVALIEESEVLRLLYTDQLEALIAQYITTRNAGYLNEYHADMAIILNRALQDPYPSVQKVACDCVTRLAQSAGQFEFQAYAEVLVKPLYGILNHKHSACRIATIQALAQCALHLDASGDSLKRLLMEVSPLLMNFSPDVRAECGKMGAMLLLKLRDRYSYFDRIIPFVLCCLKDDCPEVVDCIRPLWLECGKQYFDENELELNKQELSDPPAVNYPQNVERPFIGCRGLVQRCLRLLRTIANESSDWKDEVRVHSLKLLQQFVLHAEASMTAKFFEIYPDVARACRDATKEVAKQAYKVCDLMGRLLRYEDWSEHGFDGLAKNPNVGYLKCFYYMFKSSVSVPQKDIFSLSQLLTDPDFSQTLKPEMQNYMLKMMSLLIEKSDGFRTSTPEELMQKQMECLNMDDSLQSNCDIYKNIYISTIKVMALSLGIDTSNDPIDNTVLVELAQRVNNGSVDELHHTYMRYALGYVISLDASLEAVSEPILLLHGLMSLGGFRKPYMDLLQYEILQVFANCSDEAKVKVFTGVSMVMLKWHETIGVELEESTKLLNNFNAKIIKPYLVWNAGANAEVMRTLAAAALCSMSQGAPEEAQIVLPTVAEYMASLLEDRTAATRQYAVRALFNFGELPMEQMKPIAYGVLQRLNDPSPTIRQYAVMVIPKLKPAINFKPGDSAEAKADNFEMDVWRTFIQKAADMLYLHYDGPEKALKEAIKETIKELAVVFHDIMQERYTLTVASSYSTGTALKKLKEDLTFLN